MTETHQSWGDTIQPHLPHPPHACSPLIVHHEPSFRLCAHFCAMLAPSYITCLSLAPVHPCLLMPAHACALVHECTSPHTPMHAHASTTHASASSMHLTTHLFISSLSHSTSVPIGLYYSVIINMLTLKSALDFVRWGVNQFFFFFLRPREENH